MPPAPKKPAAPLPPAQVGALPIPQTAVPAAEEESPARRRIQMRRRKRARALTDHRGIESLESRRLMSAALSGMGVLPQVRGVGGAPADHLLFSQEPGAVVAGQNGEAVVEVVDSAGAVDTASSAAVTIALAGNVGGAAVQGTATVDAVQGIATFDAWSLNRAGGYRLQATGAGLGPAVSGAFTVSPDAADAHLVIAAQPGTVPVGGAVFPAVAVEDAFGNVVPVDDSAVTLTVIGGPRGGSLGGVTSATVKQGEARFGGLVLREAGTYTLQASDPMLADPTAVTFQAIALPGVTSIIAPRNAGTSVFGGAITIAASLRSTAGRGVPFTGTATLLEGGSTMLASMPVPATGQLKFNVSGLALGNYALTIAYSGDANQKAVVSGEIPLRVMAAPTRVSLQGPTGAVVSGQQVELDAAVSSRFPGAAPVSGTVIFMDNGMDVGAAQVDASGHASLVIPDATVGPHAFSAAYSGDGEFQFSRAAARKVSVERAPTFVGLRGPSNGFVGAGQLLVLVVDVDVPPPAQGEPSGMVIFRDGGQVLGTLPVNSDGLAILTTGLSRRGIHRISAQYSGDAVDAPAASNPLLEFVTP